MHLYATTPTIEIFISHCGTINSNEMRIGFSNKSLWSLLYLQLLSITPLVFINTIDLSGQSSIGDTVWEDINNNGVQDAGEPGISDIQLELYDQTKALVSSTVSTVNGTYLFNNVTAGSYYIQLVAHPDYKPTIPFHFNRDRNSDIDIVFQRTRIFTIDDSTDISDIDIGLVRKVPLDTLKSIGDYVWHDLNYDGLQQANEPGVPNVRLELINRSRELISSTVTDENGAYQFDDIPPGYYAVQAKLSETWNVTKRVFTDNERNSDFDIVFRRTGFIIIDGEQDRFDLDLGLYEYGQIKGSIWIDNNNCVLEQDEEPLSGRVVELMNANNRFIARTTTDDQGRYTFNRLYPDSYIIIMGNSDLANICVANTSVESDGEFYQIGEIEVNSGDESVVDIACEIKKACDWTIDIVNQANADCSDKGSVELSVMGDISPDFTISWAHTKERTLELNDLSSGIYRLSITDGECEKSIEVIIEEGLECGQLIQNISLDLKVYLEGAYDDASELMSSTLMESGYLPGLEPKTIFGRKTEAGQPYDRIPWNYQGDEGIAMTSENYYPENTIDWVLVSLRTDRSKSSTIYQQAGLLLDDGRIIFSSDSKLPIVDNQQNYFVVVEHRNHMIVMTPYAVPVYNQAITFDFTSNQSYKQLLGHGQKLVKNDRYVMFAGNMEHDSFGLSDINYADLALFIEENGSNSSYIISDLNFDADVNVRDKRLLMDNAGVFTDVPQ